jgi:predicted transcriptional regulator
MSDLPQTKATCPKDTSDSIIVSFESRWESIFYEKRLKGFIRKRLPKSLPPKFVYAYFGSPTCRIALRAKVLKIEEVPVNYVQSNAASLCISKDEIVDYCGTNPRIGLCTIGKIELARHPISLAKLKTRLAFFPPQSFLILSHHAKAEIDKLAAF